jgi:signal transduction histidine kinase
MPREDFRWLVEKIEQLGETGAGSLIHRILDDYGLPRWVAHSFSMVEVEQGRIVRGCLIPLRDEPRLMNLDGGTIARFIHKLGNQFQLLNLAVNALEKDLQDSKDLETLQQSLEKAIDLTRAFSDYSQGAASVAETNLLDILSAAVVTRKASFASEGIDLEVQLDERLRSVAISTDPFLLESAIGAILQNSLEATQRGGEVVLKASVEPGHAPHLPLARISVTDTGCGIRDEDLNKVVVPFYTSKKDHDGMGLSIAARLFDVLGGHVRIDSVQGEGTEVIIAFPINSSKGLSDL